mmetsp:Transcript_1205/g.2442  ORF Transcript_1205/g.2442 Transcript_1205/m.2442 type:complete len:274 (-) Transcript_1205:106-927(-)
MAIGAIVAMRQHRVATQCSETQRKLNEYGKNEKGKLNRDELHNLLADMEKGVPSDDEMQWVMYNATSRKDEVIKDKQELQEAIQCWERLVENEEMLQRYMFKYDKNNNGHLTMDDLATFLADELNGGEPPAYKEVLMVLKAADRSDGEEDGRISRPELLVAINSWTAIHKSYSAGIKREPNTLSVSPIKINNQEGRRGSYNERSKSPGSYSAPGSPNTHRSDPEGEPPVRKTQSAFHPGQLPLSPRTEERQGYSGPPHKHTNKVRRFFSSLAK